MDITDYYENSTNVTSQIDGEKNGKSTTQTMKQNASNIS